METRDQSDRQTNRRRYRKGSRTLKAVVDTNVLVFDTFEDSEFHKEASSGLDSLEGWGLPGMVFHELVWFFMSQKIATPKTNAKVKEYLTNEKTTFIPCSADDIMFASSKMKDHREYNDLVILSSARRIGIPLYTFDENLKTIAKRQGIELLRG